jgi:hypothetical protein
VKIAPAAPRNKERDAFKRNNDRRPRSGGGFSRFGNRGSYSGKPGGHRSRKSSFGENRNRKSSFGSRDANGGGHSRPFDRNRKGDSSRRNDRPHKPHSFSK